MVAARFPRSHIVRVAGAFHTIKVGCRMMNIGQPSASLPIAEELNRTARKQRLAATCGTSRARRH
jgi:hypothetical protein